MSIFNVALLQMTAHGADQAANLRKGEAFCRRAAALGSDLALFPEMWNIGYTFERHAEEGAPPQLPDEQIGRDLWRAPQLWKDGAREDAGVLPEVVDRWRAQAVPRDGAFVAHFQALARELRIAIAISYLEQWDGFPRNSVSLIDRHGTNIMTYAKVHTCDFDLPEAICTPGDDFYVCTLDTARGDVRVGAMICYDREFPESARVLMLKGAEIIITPNACDMEPNRLGQFRARATENMVGVAMANYARPRWGHSVAYDPIAFDQDGSRDTLVVEAGESEGVYLAPFDIDAIRDYRTREGWGNAFRRPRCYAALTALEVEPPFVRVNASGERHDRVRR